MAWKTIVVGVDHSPESLRAVELAAKIANATHAQLVPVHAVPVIPVFADVVGINPMPIFSPELQDVSTASLLEARRTRDGAPHFDPGGSREVGPPGCVRVEGLSTVTQAPGEARSESPAQESLMQ